MVREIPLSQGLVALVDDADFDRVSQYTWHAQQSKNTFYAARTEWFGTTSRRGVLLHRFILNARPDVRIDHVDRNGLNCQRHNMRVATRSQNGANRVAMPRNKIGIKGVHFVKDRRAWQARIEVEGIRKHLGYFDNEVDAGHAYDEAARREFGEFARLNFPREGERGARTELQLMRRGE